jgi:hypothetical protein
MSENEKLEGIDLTNVDPAFVITYYEHQYDRMAKFDEQSTTVTNIVITLSVLAFTFASDSGQRLTIFNMIILPSVIFLSNLFAIGYLQRSRKWISAHRNRANAVLEMNASALYQINKILQPPKPKQHFPWVGNRDLKALLHLVIMSASTAPILYFHAQPIWLTIIIAGLLLMFFFVIVR